MEPEIINPFSTKFWAAGALPFRFSQPGESIDGLVDQARRQPVCQIVGPHGSGKSTLLWELRKCYEASGENVRHLFFNDQHRCFPREITFQEDQTLFVDGFEQLSWLRQRWLRFYGKRLIVTVHRPLWWVPILYRTKPRFDIFVQMVRQMVPNPPEETVLRTVFDRSGGNFRDAFFVLYDLFTVAAPPPEVSPPVPPSV